MHVIPAACQIFTTNIQHPPAEPHFMNNIWQNNVNAKDTFIIEDAPEVCISVHVSTDGGIDLL